MGKAAVAHIYNNRGQGKENSKITSPHDGYQPIRL